MHKDWFIFIEIFGNDDDRILGGNDWVLSNQLWIPLLSRIGNLEDKSKFKCDFKKTLDLLWRNTVTVYFVNNVTLVGKVIQKRRGLFLDIFCTKKKRRKESQHPIFFALFVHFAKWLLIYLVHVFNTLEKYAMKARFACNTFSTAMTHFCT